MKTRFRKQLWIATLFLLAAFVMTVSFQRRPAVQADGIATAVPAPSASFGTHLVNASLRSTAGAPLLLMADDASSQPVSVTVQRKPNPNLPPVEEFTLMPPNPEQKSYKTTLTVRFAGHAAEKLRSQIPFTLGDQRVVLQCSASDPNIFSTQVDFDWNAFAQEQQKRKELASTGKQIPVFEGHRFVRMDNVEFVDPGEIQGALQSHEPLEFTPKAIEGTPFLVDPQTELMIVDPTVLGDTTFTWDPCTQQGHSMGDWTFGHLMESLLGPGATQQQAELLASKWFSLFTSPQNVNQFTDNARNSQAVSAFLAEWGTDNINGLPNIANAHFQLNAIVNRIDIGQGSNTSAGELRFVFGATTGCPQGGGEPGPQLFNVIFEYNVPISSCQDRFNWAQQWQNLETIFENQCSSGFPCQPLDSALDTMTESIAGAGKGNLVNLRSNEAALVGGAPDTEHWEMRAFALNPPSACGIQPPAFCQVPLQQTPQGDPLGINYGMNDDNGFFSCLSQGANCRNQTLSDFINNNTINFPGTYVVPNNFEGLPFAGASAFNTRVPTQGLPFWNGAGTLDPVARSNFSANTCNGCHGRETEVAFQQIVNRQAPAGPQLAAFLVGCNTGPLSQPCPAANLCPLTHFPACLESVNDPVNQRTNSFGDIARRETYLATVLKGCSSDGILQSLVQHRVNFVH